MESVFDKSFCLENVLPVEIWEIILIKTYDINRRKYYLKKTQLEAFSKKSAAVCAVLKKWKTSYLFERVIQVVIGFLEKEDVYKCRLICKRWTVAVDEYLERPQCWEPYINPDYVIKRKYGLDLHMLHPVELSLPSRLKYIEEIMENVTYNPFIGKYIEIDPNLKSIGEQHGNEIDDDLDRICRIFQRLGKYIWHLSWCAIGSMTDALTFYTALCRILQLLPNLKTLQVCNRICSVSLNKIPLNLIESGCIAVPKIESLYRVHFNIDNLPLEMEKAIFMSFGASVKGLSLRLNQNLTKCIHNNLSGLSELYITNVESVQELADLATQIKKSRISLKKIKVRLTTAFVVFDILFSLQILNLESISFGYSKLTEEYATCYLDVSKLENLESLRTVEVRDGINIKYEFLKYTQGLEYLYIITDYEVETYAKSLGIQYYLQSCDRTIADDIKLCLYFQMQPRSEFWIKLPRLKYIVVEYNNGEYGCIFPSYLKRPLLRYSRFTK